MEALGIRLGGPVALALLRVNMHKDGAWQIMDELEGSQ